MTICALGLWRVVGNTPGTSCVTLRMVSLRTLVTKEECPLVRKQLIDRDTELFKQTYSFKLCNW